MVSFESARESLRLRIVNLINAEPSSPHTRAARDVLLMDLHAWQRTHIAPMRRLWMNAVESSLIATDSTQTLPGLPTDVFRFARIAAHSPSHDARVFESSGTTQSDRSTHCYADLSLYNQVAQIGARAALFPTKMRLVVLAAHERESQASSLSYMLTRFSEWFADDSVWVWRDNALLIDTLRSELRRSESTRTPIAMLGTTFAFVHALDALQDQTFQVHMGSQIMTTGGSKGRARDVDPTSLREQLSVAFGVPPTRIVSEYGMTELTSQFYERSTLAERPFVSPHWVRVAVVDPFTMRELPPMTEGLLRIDDAANLDSCCSIQTSDRAVMLGPDTFRLLGRATGATLRGCSVSADVALSRDSE